MVLRFACCVGCYRLAAVAVALSCFSTSLRIFAQGAVNKELISWGIG
jgi:hypothetical protein